MWGGAVRRGDPISGSRDGQRCPEFEPRTRWDPPGGYPAPFWRRLETRPTGDEARGEHSPGRQGSMSSGVGHGVPNTWPSGPKVWPVAISLYAGYPMPKPKKPTLTDRGPTSGQGFKSLAPEGRQTAHRRPRYG